MNTLKKTIQTKGFEVFILEETDLPVLSNYITSPVSAGFPSPAADYHEDRIDLIKELISHPLYTFVMKVKGVSMQDAGIHDGDIVLIDTSIEPQDKDICVCSIDGDFTLKEISKTKDHFRLLPYNKDYEPIEITENNRFIIWGILTWSLHKQFKRRNINSHVNRNR